MVEGWSKDEHYILFDTKEAVVASTRYSIERWLPGFAVLGLKGWDDLLVRNITGQVFSVPCVPLVPEHLVLSPGLPQAGTLAVDARYACQIKWYVKPLVFGGSPTEPSNIRWVSHEEHGQLVAWWNELYSQLKAQSAIGA